jgi:hypothetical protein
MPFEFDQWRDVVSLFVLCPVHTRQTQCHLGCLNQDWFIIIIIIIISKCRAAREDGEAASVS